MYTSYRCSCFNCTVCFKTTQLTQGTANSCACLLKIPALDKIFWSIWKQSFS